MPPPGVVIHWRSCTTTPCAGLAIQVAAPSLVTETVALPSHRSVMYSVLGLVGSAATFESPPPGRLARPDCGVSTHVAPPSVDLNTLLGLEIPVGAFTYRAEPSDATAMPGSPRFRPWDGLITTGANTGVAPAPVLRPAPVATRATATTAAPGASKRRSRRFIESSLWFGMRRTTIRAISYG